MDDDEVFDESLFRDTVLLDHIVHLTDQVRRLATLLRQFGVNLPADIGTLGVPTPEVFDRLTAEATERLQVQQLHEEEPR